MYMECRKTWGQKDAKRQRRMRQDTNTISPSIAFEARGKGGTGKTGNEVGRVAI